MAGHATAPVVRRSTDVGCSNDNEPNPNVCFRSHGIHTAAPASSRERVLARVTHCATGGDDWLATLPQFRRGQEHDEARTVVATVSDGDSLPYDPPSVPRDVMQLVSGFHSRHEVWWVGALARCLLRPAPSLASKKRFLDRGKRASRSPARLASGPVHRHAHSAHGKDRAGTERARRVSRGIGTPRIGRVRGSGRGMARGKVHGD